MLPAGGRGKLRVSLYNAATALEDAGRMDIRLSRRIQSVAPSATLAVSARAKALKEQGIDVVDFGAGEPDFDTPQHIKDAATRALAAGDTKYPSPVSGRNPLRAAVCEYTKRYLGLDYRPGQVHVSVGAKDAIIQTLTVLLDPGDEVMIPAPYWVSYPDQVRLAGGTPVIVRPPNAHIHKITGKELAAAITPRTRVLILNSPCNPTGAVYSRDELDALAAAIRGTNIVVISDELYHRLILNDRPHVSFATLDGMYEHTIVINGASKTFAMTGWRLGFATGPEPIIAAMGRMQGQTTSGAVSFVQTAMVAALNGDQNCVETMRRAYRERAGRMVAGLERIPGVHCEPPEGGFVCLPHVAGAFAKLGAKTADEFAAGVLERAHVALVSGSAFGADEHVRLSFATSTEQIDKGLDRLTRLLGG
jgi:aspartate aminotransferase